MTKSGSDVFIGFDSAWADNPRAPGAICAVGLRDGRQTLFQAPRLVGFGQALDFIREHASLDGVTILALDQPTLVPNATGMRPAEKVAASVIARLGGGVQPASRSRKGLFCDEAPIWTFLRALNATEDPEAARTATNGLYLMEVYPALALASLDPGFFGRKCGPRYNPAKRRTFKIEDWMRVTAVAAALSRGFACLDLAAWCDAAGPIARPTKADQDRLDAVLCTLVALRWRLAARHESMMIGDLKNGYIVVPASAEVRLAITSAARARVVPVDGAIP